MQGREVFDLIFLPDWLWLIVEPFELIEIEYVYT